MNYQTIINDSQLADFKTTCANAFCEISGKTSNIQTCMSKVESMLFEENKLTVQNVAEMIFENLFEHYESDLFSKRYDVFVDDDIPDMIDDLYVEMYENYISVLNETHEMNIS